MTHQSSHYLQDKDASKIPLTVASSETVHLHDTLHLPVQNDLYSVYLYFPSFIMGLF